MAGYRDFAFFYDLLMKNADDEGRFGYIIGLLAENGIGKGILLDMACGTGTLSKMFEDENHIQFFLHSRLAYMHRQKKNNHCRDGRLYGMSGLLRTYHHL